MAAGDEPKWKALAEQELKFPATLDEELALADGWYDLAGGVKGPLHDVLLRDAAGWYRAALQSMHQKISDHDSGSRNGWPKSKRQNSSGRRVRRSALRSLTPIRFLPAGATRIGKSCYCVMAEPAKLKRRWPLRLYWLAHHQMQKETGA